MEGWKGNGGYCRKWPVAQPILDCFILEARKKSPDEERHSMIWKVRFKNKGNQTWDSETAGKRGTSWSYFLARILWRLEVHIAEQSKWQLDQHLFLHAQILTSFNWQNDSSSKDVEEIRFRAGPKTQALAPGQTFPHPRKICKKVNPISTPSQTLPPSNLNRQNGYKIN